jgi:hypothetical protein
MTSPGYHFSGTRGKNPVVHAIMAAPLLILMHVKLYRASRRDDMRRPIWHMDCFAPLRLSGHRYEGLHR